MTAPDLKPCPFCGGEKVYYYPSWKPKDSASHRSHPYVRCHTCSAVVNGEQGDYSMYAQSAVAAWNTRTDLSRDLEQARQDIADLRQAVRYANDHADQAKSERDAALARAEKAEADRDEWRKTAITKIEMADSTAFRDNDATIATLQARVRELESVFSHLYGQAVWLRGDQAYKDFARAFIKRMGALRIKCVSRQELAKIEGKTE